MTEQFGGWKSFTILRGRAVKRKTRHYFYEVVVAGGFLFSVWVLPKVYKQWFLSQPAEFSKIISHISYCFQPALFTL